MTCNSPVYQKFPILTFSQKYQEAKFRIKLWKTGIPANVVKVTSLTNAASDLQLCSWNPRQFNVKPSGMRSD